MQPSCKKPIQTQKINTFKITLNILIISVAFIISYMIQSNQIQLKFQKLIELQFWRIFSSLFYIKNYFWLILKILMIIHLSILLERKKKSVYFFIDLWFKQIGLIFLSTICYIFVYLFSQLFEGVFSIFLNFIDSHSYETFQYVYLIEIFLTALQKNDTIQERSLQQILSDKKILIVISILLTLINLQHILFWSALSLALIEHFFLFEIYKDIQQLQIVKFTEKKLQHFSSFLYMTNKQTNDKDLFDQSQNEQINQNEEILKLEKITTEIQKIQQETQQEFQTQKINPQNYIIKEQIDEEHNIDESFEI